jgi:hypothetical protein
MPAAVLFGTAGAAAVVVVMGLAGRRIEPRPAPGR